MIRVERHALGPRCFVLGRRLHEWHAGAVLLIAAVLAAVADATVTSIVLGVLGAWLVAKDWRDLFPRWRNTQTHRRFGLHLPHGSRLRLRLDLPAVAATATLVVAAVNAASALTPSISWRGHDLLRIEPVAALPIFHAVAFPASVALVLTAVYLARRRRRALWSRIGLLLVLGVAEGSRASTSRRPPVGRARRRAVVRAERVRRPPREAEPAHRAAPACRPRHHARRGGARDLACWLGARGDTDPSMRIALREVGALLTLQAGPTAVRRRLAWLPLGAGAPLPAALVLAAWAAVPAARAPRATEPPDASPRRARAEARPRHAERVQAARDPPDRSSPRRPRVRRPIACRAASCCVAGDPVGPDDALPALLRRAARVRGRARAAGRRGRRQRGVRRARARSGPALAVHRRRGDRRHRRVLARGRPIKKVRQAVNRLVREGYTSEVRASARSTPRR